MLAAMASATRRIRLGVMVTGNIYRHPAVLAKMAATVDVVSHGRLELGIGAGWNQQECDTYGIDLPPLKQRFDMFDEACEVLIALLSNTTSDFAGTHYQLTDARCEPKPVQKPHPPICIGGGGERRTLRAVLGTRSTGTCRLVTSRRSSGSERCSRSIARRSTVTRRRSRLPRTCASILRRARRHSLTTRPNGARAASISASSTCRRPTNQRCSTDRGRPGSALDLMGSAALADALERVESVGPLIVERAESAEARGCLDEDVVEAMHDRGLYRTLVPREPRRTRPHPPRERRGGARRVDFRRLRWMDVRHHVRWAVVRPPARRGRVHDHLQRASRRRGRIPQPADRARRARRWWLPLHRHRPVRERVQARHLARGRRMGAS